MGKGDRKTKRGKIAKGTYGVSRPRPGTDSHAPENTGAEKKKSTKKKSAKSGSEKK